MSSEPKKIEDKDLEDVQGAGGFSISAQKIENREAKFVEGRYKDDQRSPDPSGQPGGVSGGDDLVK